jgi:gamma-glutamyltranspeptidase / glutathione hydrolase
MGRKVANVLLTPGIAAGHPATAEAGFGVLEDGGSAADAAVAASLASCVAETVMTGLAGGGHAIWFDGRTREVRLLDFFVAVPGLGLCHQMAPLEDIGIPFGNEIVHYQVGTASCAVPGVPAGLDELWRRYGRLPWARLVEPALALAREGVEIPPAHAACLAMLAPVMTLREGAQIYSPGGSLLDAGDRLEQPGLVNALELVRDEGARTFYNGTIASALVGLMEDREGPVTWDDLQAYTPAWRAPMEGAYLGTRVLTRGGLSNLVNTLSTLPILRTMTAAERALTLASALVALPYTGEGEEIGDPIGNTTNLVTADLDGNACVLTTSLGLGSGDYLPGLDVHLNSMLGEVDLQVEPLVPGERMHSMMSPTLILDDEGLAMAAGAAGGTRLRPALVQVLSGILDEGLAPQQAVDRPRIHSTGDIVRVEPGFEEEALSALEAAGYDVRPFPTLHHYFGGVSLIARNGGAADPRRSGAALALP